MTRDAVVMIGTGVVVAIIVTVFWSVAAREFYRSLRRVGRRRRRWWN